MDLEPYLRRTRYLDFDHPLVAALVSSVPPGDDKARAIALFLKVRDGFRYDPYRVMLQPEYFAASTTVERGRGFCVAKAIVYAAGLRGLGIPSRLGFCDVRNHISSPQLLELLRTEVFAYHGFTEVWLNGRWLKVTPAFNASLCAKFGAPPIDFDGEHDAVLQPMNAKGDRFMEYLKDRGVSSDFNLDDMLVAWREVYPHLFTGIEGPEGDFEAEVIAPPR
ncbi:MAG: transglutaminase family protein [Myxococcaceae bacterium]